MLLREFHWSRSSVNPSFRVCFLLFVLHLENRKTKKRGKRRETSQDVRGVRKREVRTSCSLNRSFVNRGSALTTIVKIASVSLRLAAKRLKRNASKTVDERIIPRREGAGGRRLIIA